MKSHVLYSLVVIGALACGSVTSAKQPQFQWSHVATDDGEIQMPLGWHIRVRVSHIDPIFDLYSRDPFLAVFVLTVSQSRGEATLFAATERQLTGLGAPSAFRMEPQPEGWSYGEKIVSPGQVFAACAVNYGSAKARNVLAIARLMNAPAVSQKAYDAAGGRKLLCEIAASVTRLPRLVLE